MTVQVVSHPWTKPLPNIDHDNRAFWEGLRDHRFLLWHCNKCGSWYWPKAYCTQHPVGPFAEDMGWSEASGLGTIFSANRHHWSFHPGFQNDVPYVYALVELDEGPLISSTLLGHPSEPIGLVGHRCAIAYEDHPDDGFTLPRFELLPEPATSPPPRGSS